MSVTYYPHQTEHVRQFLGYSDVAAPIPASEVRVFLSEKDYKKRKVYEILDKDGNRIRRNKCQK